MTINHSNKHHNKHYIKPRSNALIQCLHRNSDQNRIQCSLLIFRSTRATTSLGRASFQRSYWPVLHTLLDILLDRATPARPVEPLFARPSVWSSCSQFVPLLVALFKQLSSTVPNLKPPIFDKSLSTLSKVQDKACSTICLKLTSLLRLLALALTQRKNENE